MLRLASPRPPATIVALLAGAALLTALAAGCGPSRDTGAPVEAGGSGVSGGSGGTGGTAAAIAPPVAVGPASVAVDSVSAGPSPAGGWQAAGLVRNDGAAVAGGVHVRVTLADRAGAVVGQAEADSPVAAVRPGETVPFRVVSTAPADQVASVTWQAFATAGPTATGARDLVASTYWTRPYGDSHRLDLPAYRDPTGGTTPYALYGALANPGPVPIASPTLVLAWVGPDGRVVTVAAGPAVDPSGAAATSLTPGASDDVLVLVDDPVAGPALRDLAPRTWTTAR